MQQPTFTDVRFLSKMSNLGNEQKDVKTEIKTEPGEPVQETQQPKYEALSYCVHAKDVKMPSGLLIRMLERNPHFILLSNCPRDPCDDPSVNVEQYQIRHNGGFYIFVRKGIEIIAAGPSPGEQRTTFTVDPNSQCSKDVTYFYVDVSLKLHSGVTQRHRLLAVYHPIDEVKKDDCKKVVCAKLNSAIGATQDQPITHICGALNWQKGQNERVANREEYPVSKIFEEVQNPYKYKFFVNNKSGAEISQYFNKDTPQNVEKGTHTYSTRSWGTLYTNRENALKMEEKPLHPLGKLSTGQKQSGTESQSPDKKSNKQDQIAAVVQFYITPFKEETDLMEYTVYSYCCQGDKVNITPELLSGMLNKKPDILVLSNCPRDPTDYPDYHSDFSGIYKIRYNGGFYFFVKIEENGLRLSEHGPDPEQRRAPTDEIAAQTNPAQDCHRDVSYYYVDVNLPLPSGERQTHRILSTFHKQDSKTGTSGEFCVSVISAKLQPSINPKDAQTQPITHICGALNIRSNEGSKCFGENYKYKFEGTSQNFNLNHKLTAGPNRGRGVLFTNTPGAVAMTEVKHPDTFLPGFRSDKKIGAVVVFTIKAVLQPVKAEPAAAAPIAPPNVVVKTEGSNVDQLGEQLDAALRFPEDEQEFE